MLVVSNTLLRSVATCDTQAVVRCVLKLTTDAARAPLEAGMCAHEALATYLRTGDATKALAVYDGLYQPWAAEHAELVVGMSRGEAIVLAESRLSHTNTRTVLARWFETHPPDGFPLSIDAHHVERYFQLPFARGVTFEGRLDALGFDRQAGAWVVVEHKTTSRVDDDFLRAFRMDSQNSGYVWAAGRLAITDGPVVGSLLNAIEFSQLPNSDRKCFKHGTAYRECGPYHATWATTSLTRSAEQLEAWRLTALELVARFKHLRRAYATVAAAATAPQQGMFSGACRWCEVREWCAVGRPAGAMTSMFVEQGGER